MARIIGGIGTSHVPTIGLAVDRGKQNDPRLGVGVSNAPRWSPHARRAARDLSRDQQRARRTLNSPTRRTV